jgi:ABC-type amino acid transport substrate-binding protein
MAGKLIGVQRASTYANLIEQRFPDAEVRLYDTVENHNLDLTAGRIDGVIAQRIFMSNWLDRRGRRLRDEGRGDARPRHPGPWRRHRRAQGGHRAAGTARRALTQIMDDGTYDEINDRYFAVSLMPER